MWPWEDFGCHPGHWPLLAYFKKDLSEQKKDVELKKEAKIPTERRKVSVMQRDVTESLHDDQKWGVARRPKLLSMTWPGWEGRGRCVAFIPELCLWCYNNSVFPFSGSSWSHNGTWNSLPKIQRYLKTTFNQESMFEQINKPYDKRGQVSSSKRIEGVKSQRVMPGTSILIFPIERAFLRDKINLSSVTKRDRVNLIAWPYPFESIPFEQKKQSQLTFCSKRQYTSSKIPCNNKWRQKVVSNKEA